MKKIVLVFISSFFVGMVTGAYVYITVFHPTFVLENYFTIGSKDTVLTGAAPASDGFVIVGDSYGACLRTNGCASYRIENDGLFVYSGEQNNSGTITHELREETGTKLAAARLDLLSDIISTAGDSCATAVNQTEFNYTIQYNNQTYQLDTCHSTFDAQSDLGQLLTNFWGILPTLE